MECECLDVGRAGTDDLPAWAESGLAPPTLAVSADPDWEGDQALAQETHSATSVAPSFNKDRQLHWFCGLRSRLTNVRLTHMLLLQLFLTRRSLPSRGFALALAHTHSHSRTHTHALTHGHTLTPSLSHSHFSTLSERKTLHVGLSGPLIANSWGRGGWEVGV